MLGRLGEAENLNLNVIAGGCGDQKRLEFLRRRGCKEYQGNLFARLMPPEEFATQLRAASSADPPVVPVRDPA